jgi:hypothetical protein
MDAERRFWTALEFRVCDEMQNEPNCRRLRLWCDGFIPEQYFLDQEPNRVTGVAWIGTDLTQEAWAFSLILSSSASSRADINWAGLLPPPEAKVWLVVAPQKKEIEVRFRE